MFRSCPTGFRPAIFTALALISLAAATQAQERRAHIRVENYTIDAEVQPATQALIAAAELNNALTVSRVVDGKGTQINDTRNQQDFTVRLSFDQPLPKGQPATLKFTYEGRLSGSEDSPVYGIKFAAIHPDYAFLLYPARWFPISGYTTDRFTADLRITVPTGYQVLGSGIDTHQAAGDKVVYSFHFDHPSFPGSIAVVRDPGAKVSSEGVTSTLYFRGDEKGMAQQYGEQIGQMMTFFTGDFGLPPYANLTVVETENGAPNGYAAPGLIFLNPHAIGKQVGAKLLANQISRQWWEVLVSPTTRNHLWLTNGLASYSELLWTEHTAGPGAVESQFREGLHGGQRSRHPVGAHGGLFSGAVGADRQQGCGRSAHVALRRRRSELHANVEGVRHAIQLEIGVHRGLQKGGPRRLQAGSRLLLHPMDRIQRRARIQAGVHYLPHAERLPRDGQSGAGHGYLPHARGSEDRDRGQS